MDDAGTCHHGLHGLRSVDEPRHSASHHDQPHTVLWADDSRTGAGGVGLGRHQPALTDVGYAAIHTLFGYQRRDDVVHFPCLYAHVHRECVPHYGGHLCGDGTDRLHDEDRPFVDGKDSLHGADRRDTGHHREFVPQEFDVRLHS